MSSSSDDSAGAIGIPQIILGVIAIAIFYRWFTSSSPSGPEAVASNSGRRSRTSNGPPVNADAVEALRAMFPQVSAAAIRWDLERNGGRLETTTEKILSEGTLPEPPASSSFQTPGTTPSPSGSRGSTVGMAPSPIKSTSGYTDLIARYNLHSRLNSFQPGSSRAENASLPNKKNDKASLFLRGRERRDVMILEARKKMEEMLGS
ncbi:hypothetical protein AA313_de0209641 [Arthrobotrys entomopaga]|nr:hypothetical protein AA313_de0209641 [Arthrobotrys entomopaga]